MVLVGSFEYATMILAIAEILNGPSPFYNLSYETNQSLSASGSSETEIPGKPGDSILCSHKCISLRTTRVGRAEAASSSLSMQPFYLLAIGILSPMYIP